MKRRNRSGQFTPKVDERAEVLGFLERLRAVVYAGADMQPELIAAVAIYAFERDDIRKIVLPVLEGMADPLPRSEAAKEPFESRGPAHESRP